MPQRLGPLRATLRPILFLILFVLPGLPLIGAAGIFIGHSVAATRHARAAARAPFASSPATAPPPPVLPAPPSLSAPSAAHNDALLTLATHATRRVPPLHSRAPSAVVVSPHAHHHKELPGRARPRYLWSAPVAAAGHASRHGAIVGAAERRHSGSVLASLALDRDRAPVVSWSRLLVANTTSRPRASVTARGVAPSASLVSRTRSLASTVGHGRVAARHRAVAPSALTPYVLPNPPVLARAAYLYDVTNGQVLYAKNADAGLPMASTTKIMTALLAIKYGRLDDMVTASYAAATIGESTMYLRQGEQLPLRDLLYGLMLPSGNDAAIAIAEHVGGSVPAFVAMMNREAALLGMTQTHFATPHGLDAVGHYASARDMARLAMAAMALPVFRQVVSTRSYSIPATAHNDAHASITSTSPSGGTPARSASSRARPARPAAAPWSGWRAATARSCSCSWAAPTSSPTCATCSTGASATSRAGTAHCSRPSTTSPSTWVGTAPPCGSRRTTAAAITP